MSVIFLYIFLKFFFKEKKVVHKEKFFKECKKLNFFLVNAPADEIKLIYASQNILSSTSMMGHAFITISGKNQKGESVSHALSYFGKIKKNNPFWLISTTNFVWKAGIS